MGAWLSNLANYASAGLAGYTVGSNIQQNSNLAMQKEMNSVNTAITQVTQSIQNMQMQNMQKSNTGISDIASILGIIVAVIILLIIIIKHSLNCIQKINYAQNIQLPTVQVPTHQQGVQATSRV